MIRRAVVVVLGAVAFAALLPEVSVHAAESELSAERLSASRIPGWAPEPWLPYDQPEFAWPAGEACEFEVAVEVVSQNLYTRVSMELDLGSELNVCTELV